MPSNKVFVEKLLWWCESDRVEDFEREITKAINADTKALGEKAYQYLINHYTVEQGYSIIQKRLK